MCIRSHVKGYSGLSPKGIQRGKKRDIGRQIERESEREHMSGGVQSLRYYHMKDLPSLCMD